MKNTKLILSYFLVFLWMGMIFYLSNQPAIESSGLSTGLVKRILKATGAFMKKTFDIHQFDHLLRKNAHFFVYLVLSLLVLSALRRSGLRGYKAMVAAFVICVLYAISDEYHQTFVAGRSGELADVVIDSLGALLGILIYYAIATISVKSRNRIKNHYFSISLKNLNSPPVLSLCSC